MLLLVFVTYLLHTCSHQFAVLGEHPVSLALLLHHIRTCGPLPLQDQPSAITRPGALHLRKHPLVCPKVARRVEVDGMVETDLRHSSASCSLDIPLPTHHHAHLWPSLLHAVYILHVTQCNNDILVHSLHPSQSIIVHVAKFLEH